MKRFLKIKVRSLDHLANIQLLVKSGLEGLDIQRHRSGLYQEYYEQAYTDGQAVLREVNSLYFLWRKMQNFEDEEETLS